MLKHIDKDVVIGFLNWIEQDRGCSTSSRNVRLAALHSFFRYLQYRDPADIYTWQSILAIPVKKTVKPSIYYLTIEGVRLIFAEPDLTTQSGLEVSVHPRGYRVLQRIPRLPAPIIENLINRFGNFQSVLKASIEELDDVEGIGEVRAKAIRNGLRRLQDQVMLERYM